MQLDSDRKGMLVAGLCFVHCVAGPALLAFAGMASLGSFSERIEPLLLLTSTVFGAAALVPAYWKRHGRLSCIVLFTGGIACLLLRKRIDFGGVIPEAMATGMGAALVITSHALNLRFSKRCPCCEPGGKEGSQRAGAEE